MYPLSVHELPYKTAIMDVSVLWSERNCGDAAQDWLRGMLARATESLRQVPTETEVSPFSSPIAPLPRVAVRA